MIILYIVSIIIGYLLGSVSPAYIIGKFTRGIDIREHGSKNAGTMNAFHVLGKTAGITTLVFDLVKGVLAALITYCILIGPRFSIAYFSGTPFIIMCLAGFAAILGHDFPFYLKFKGGKGGATAGGIIIALLVLLWKQEILLGISWLTWIPFIILIFFGLSIFVITKSGNLVGLVCYPLVAIWILISKLGIISIAIYLFFLYLFIVSIINLAQKGKGALKKEIKFATERKKGEIKLWRKAMRFASLIFPILYFWLTKTWILSLIGFFFVLFLAFDFVRIRKRIVGLYKKAESKISGFTFFLVGGLIAVAFFPRNIAILALTFAAVGDNFAILLGIPFGRTKLFREKSLQGTVACLASSFLAGLIWMPLLNISILIIIAGAVAATLAELFSGWYDNLTMAPFAAAVMAIVLRFL